MKKFVLDNCMTIIENNNNFDKIKLAEIRYGLEGIYLTFTKLIIISILAIIIGMFKEMILFLLIYNIIRIPSFGLHAKKSWICLLTSTIAFIGIPYLSLYTTINLKIKIIIGILSIIGMVLFAPADTKKKPIVSKKRRMIFKTVSTIITSIYIILAIIINNNFIVNCLIYSLILQNIMISPITYKIFKMPYNNYKEYIKIHGLN